MSTVATEVARDTLPARSSASNASTYVPFSTASHVPSTPPGTFSVDRRSSVQDDGSAPAPTNSRYSLKSSGLNATPLTSMDPATGRECCRVAY